MSKQKSGAKSLIITDDEQVEAEDLNPFSFREFLRWKNHHRDQDPEQDLNQEQTRSKTMKCFSCGEEGHLIRSCPRRQNQDTLSTQRAEAEHQRAARLGFAGLEDTGLCSDGPGAAGVVSTGLEAAGLAPVGSGAAGPVSAGLSVTSLALAGRVSDGFGAAGQVSTDSGVHSPVSPGSGPAVEATD